MAGGALAILLGSSFAGAFALGAMFALSSTAYVLRILSQRAALDSPPGRLSIGVLLAQDVAVVPLVLMTSVLLEGKAPGPALLSLGRLVALALLLALAFRVLFHVVVPRLLGSEVMRRSRQLPILLAITSGLGSAIAAHELGISPAIGAFLAGMLLAESPFATQVRADVGTLRILLMTLFFGSIGMLGDPEWILAHLPLVLGVVFAIVLFKTLLTTLSLRMVRAPLPAALAAGVSLAQIGEFSFVIAEMSRGVLLDHETFQLVVSVTIVTLALTPYLISFGPWLAARMRTRRSSVSDASAAVIEGHVVVVGYGPTGEAVVRRLEDVGFSVHVVDLNRGLVDRAALDGHTAHVGDAAHPEVLEHAGVNRAIAVVATLPDPDGSRRCVEQVRALVPCARLFVRAPYHRHRSSLLQAGAEAVVDEEEQVGRALAHVVAEALQPSGETGGDSLGGEPESSPVPNEGP